MVMCNGTALRYGSCRKLKVGCLQWFVHHLKTPLMVVTHVMIIFEPIFSI